MKKISVIIPVYNAEKTIRRCLESIMSSEYEEYEVIVVDDGSTDNSASILFGSVHGTLIVIIKLSCLAGAAYTTHRAAAFTTIYIRR